MLFKTCLFFCALFPLFAIESPSCILIDAKTGHVLFEKNAYTTKYPASLTKVATALFTIKQRQDKLNLKAKVSQNAIGWVKAEAIVNSNYTLPSYHLTHGSTHAGLKANERYKLIDLLYAMMLISANDAANVLAEYVGGTIPQFVEDLNAYLKDIGCKDTHFKNPHGMHHPDHKSTAWDLANMGVHAIQDPLLCQIVGTIKYPFSEKTTLYQYNKLLKRGKYYLPEAIGIKTGYHKRAGHCLLAAAKKGDRLLVACVLGAKKGQEYKDAIELFKLGFAAKKVQKEIIACGPQTPKLHLPKAGKAIETETKEAFSVEHFPKQTPQFRCLLCWNTLKLPVKKGDKVGALVLKDSSDNLVKRIDLFAKNHVDFHWIFKVKRICFHLLYLAPLSLLLFLMFRKRR